MKNKHYVLLAFAIVFGWVMSLPYEGPVMYALAGERGLNGVALNLLTVFCHSAGLFTGQFISKDLGQAKTYVLRSTAATMAVSLLMPFVDVNFWLVIIPILAYITGTIIASFAHMINASVPDGERSMFGADILIYGNVVLIVAHVFANNLAPMISFVVIELILGMAIYGIYQMAFDEEETAAKVEPIKLTDFSIFFIFIFIISINSGIMFQVIYPYFADFPLLTSLYTNVPYILAIYILSRRVETNKLNFLYMGLGLWIVTFMLFTFVGPTAIGFIVICTVMLSAAGIFDFFWWSTMTNNLGHVSNPAALLGTGLSLNVLGVWTGGLLGNLLMNAGFAHEHLSYVGILVVAICMTVIMPLNNRLSELLDSNEFLRRFSDIAEEEKETYMSKAETLLSKREYEVFSLLIQGKKDSEICKELHISLNTAKTHNRNIYKKLGVNSRLDLIDRVHEV